MFKKQLILIFEKVFDRSKRFFYSFFYASFFGVAGDYFTRSKGIELKKNYNLHFESKFRKKKNSYPNQLCMVYKTVRREIFKDRVVNGNGKLLSST